MSNSLLQWFTTVLRFPAELFRLETTLTGRLPLPERPRGVWPDVIGDSFLAALSTSISCGQKKTNEVHAQILQTNNNSQTNRKEMKIKGKVTYLWLHKTP